MEFGKSIRNLWNLDKDIVFLNNGSFGATPIHVLEDFYKWTKRAEEEPVMFFVDKYFSLIRETADEIAEFLGANGTDLAFIDNATTGVNTILNSLPNFNFADGELLTTNHVYPAVRNAMKYYAERINLSYREINIPFPSKGDDEILEIFEKNITVKTRLLVIDHVASATALVFPAKKIAEICRKKNVLILVDGAHAPGMFELNIPDIVCDFYTGNLHKWLFAPKGSAVLWVRPELQNLIHPLTISLFFGQGFTHEFDWTGTKTPSSYLSSTTALHFFQSLGKDIYSYRTELLKQAVELLASELKLEMPAPDENLGTLASFFVPNDKMKDAASLRRTLLDNYNIELFTSDFEGKLLFRISVQVFNHFEEYQLLTKALKEIL